MIVIGELINTSRKAIEPLVIERKEAAIQELAKKQVEAGAHYIDVNAGTLVGQEPEALQWLVQTVQAVVDSPVCIDSPDPKALEAALAVYKGTPMINSITAEKERYEEVLPLVKEFGAKVVALCIEDEGMPKTLDDHIRIANELIERLIKDGVEANNIYVDPLVRPVSTDTSAAMDFLQTIENIMGNNAGVHTVCGLSNVSYGLPKRMILNRVLFITAMVKGLDTVIIDPLDKQTMALLKATQVILNKDEYCLDYLKAVRSGAMDF